jgi:hypothetical protein
VVDPHHPALEQQLPKPEPWQVKAAVPPQVASVETFLVGVAAADVETFVEETATLVERTELTTAEELVPVQVPAPAWQPVPQ